MVDTLRVQTGAQSSSRQTLENGKKSASSSSLRVSRCRTNERTIEKQVQGALWGHQRGSDTEKKGGESRAWRGKIGLEAPLEFAGFSCFCAASELAHQAS